MSIVSGLATASGVSPLLNAPRDTNRDQSATTAGADLRAVGHDLQGAGKRAGERFVPRPVLQALPTQAQGATAAREHADGSRYARFVDAVLALRLDHDLTYLPRHRAAAVMAAGREIFKMDDGLPKTVRPPEPAPAPTGSGPGSDAGATSDVTPVGRPADHRATGDMRGPAAPPAPDEPAPPRVGGTADDPSRTDRPHEPGGLVPGDLPPDGPADAATPTPDAGASA